MVLGLGNHIVGLGQQEGELYEFFALGRGGIIIKVVHCLAKVPFPIGGVQAGYHIHLLIQVHMKWEFLGQVISYHQVFVGAHLKIYSR